MTENLDVKNLEVENPRVAQATSRTGPDAIDAILEVWARELPELDLDTEGIVERIQSLERYVDRAMRETLDDFELTHGEYKLAMHLRYGGPPYTGKPGKLAKHLGLSTGAMTNRLDNMEKRGLIRRLDDPDDRRGVIVELLPEGREVWERAVGAQSAKEQFVASGLSKSEQKQLNDLLRRMVHSGEQAATLD